MTELSQSPSRVPVVRLRSPAARSARATLGGRRVVLDLAAARRARAAGAGPLHPTAKAA